MKLNLSIRAKTLLLSCVLLAIPWIGYRYAGELERVLRDGQQQAVLHTARAIATALNDRPSLFQARADGRSEDPSLALIAHRLPRPIELDGNLDEWLRMGVSLRALGREQAIEQVAGVEIEPIALWYALGLYDRELYAALEVIDDRVIYRDAANPRPDAADHVRIGLVTPWGELRRYVVSAFEPGPVTAIQMPTDPTSPRALPEPRIQGFWRETASGFNLELRLPRALVGPRLGFAFADVDDPDTRAIRSIVGSIGSGGREALGTAMVPPPELVQIVRSLAHEGTRVWIVATDRRLVARSGVLGAAAPWQYPSTIDGTRDWLDGVETLLRPIYRALLPPPVELGLEVEPLATQYPSEEAEAALAGRTAAGLRTLADAAVDVLVAAHPVWADERVIGAVIVEETTQGVQAVRQRLLERLLTLTLGAFVLAALALFLFGSRLSGRIRQLRDEAEQAIDSAGRLQAVTASSSAGDEIGDLSRSFSSVLDRLAQYTRYLESLAARLSHELRTPIAVVRSSLDNLKMQPLPQAADVYVERAEQGLARLATIITRMTEATRLERILRQAERERFDLGAVVRGCVDGYRAAYPNKSIVLVAPDEPVSVTGVADLIAQMLDKLVANAVDFTRPDHPIEIELRTLPSHAVLIVRNAGPRLPAESRGRLFQSMMSVRPHSAGDEPHLGLGLYIAHLIVDFHHGKIEARDRTDIEGVEVEVRLPRLISDPG